MRLHPAEGRPSIPPLALVLGPRCVAELIGESLRSEGFEVEFESDLPGPIPASSDPDAVGAFRNLLSAFAERAGGGEGPGCIHPGVSHWADRPELTQVGQEFGLIVIGPPLKQVSFFSSKLSLLLEAERMEIPNLLLSTDPISTVRELGKLLGNRGAGRLPVVLKSARGGARDVLVLHHSEDLDRKLTLWIEQLRKKHGEVILLAERYLESARQISVPFARMRDGTFRAFPLIDGSLQSRNRKIIEFCPPPALDPAMEEQLVSWTERLAHELSFMGVGQFEFLVDGPRAYLVEGIARLGSSFHLWEQAARTNAVSWQIQAQTNSRLNSQWNPSQATDRGGAYPFGISLHLYAEDPLLQLPQPGRVHQLDAQRSWQLPGGRAEVVFSIREGEDISSDEGWVGQVRIGAQNFEQAISIAKGSLDTLWIAGSMQTNERFISELLAHPWVREGMFHAGFVDEEFVPEVRPSTELLTLFCSVCASLKEQKPGCRWAVADQWVRPNFEALKWIGTPEVFELQVEKGIQGVLELSDGRKLRVCAYPIRENRWQVRVGNWTLSVRQVQVQRGGAKKLVSLVSGSVHSIFFREGAIVAAHDPLLVVDSLQTLVSHALPVDVRVLRWNVGPESTVHAGQDLAELEVIATRG